MSWLTKKAETPPPTVNVSTSESSAAPPSLESFAGSTDTHAGTVSTGGQCPGCHASIGDAVKVCPQCGVWTRLHECRKCHQRVTPGSFCAGCGTPAPVAPEKPIAPGAPTQLQAPAVELPPLWTEETSGGVAELIDFGLTLDGIKQAGASEDEIGALTDEEKAQITKHTVPVLNRYMRGAGKYAELINLGACIGMICAPKLLIRHVIIPRRERLEMEKERMRLESEREMHARRLEEARKQRDAGAST